MNPAADRGLAMIEAAIAVALASLASLALLSVSVAMTSQARSARDGSTARSVAAQLAEQATAHGCGLQTGAEPSSVLIAAVTSCATALKTSDAILLGDVSMPVVRNGLTYTATISNRWLRSGDGTADAATCADLVGSEPVAMQRTVTVTWQSGSGTTNSFAQSQVEALPVDAAAFQSGRGGLLVTGIPAGAAVDLQTPLEPTLRVRRYGDRSGCAWFPYLSPADYAVSAAGTSAFVTTTVVEAATTSITYVTVVGP
ncbi:unannotated protein [freshwater metagenome]|uniref:Unannotated protein n=1 Tax=freshwater metagenome TaxID=449393 RepID=A0A6J7F3S0_9ZZZZ|nr:hypothetical protein [Actinomycetota bacterium]